MTTRMTDAKRLVFHAITRGATVSRCNAGWRVWVDGRLIATVHESLSQRGLRAARADIERGLRRRTLPPPTTRGTP